MTKEIRTIRWRLHSLPFSFVATSAFVAATLITSSSLAFLPSSRTIVSRTVKNHGKGLYAIEQEVQIRTALDPIVLRERWIVENGENLRLTVSAPKGAAEAARYDVVYREGKKTSPDLKGGLSTTRLPAEFLESFSHARSGKGLLDAFVRSGVVPGSFLKERPRTVKAGNFTYFPEPLVRLGRSSGVVAWAIGEATPVNGSKQKPGAWIEQDAFLLRRLRFPSEAEMFADKHSTYAGALKLPRERTITWGTNSAVIRVISAKPVNPAQAGSFLLPSSITQAEAKAARLPDQPQVREFYSRFR